MRFDKSAGGSGAKYLRKTPGLNAELRYDATNSVYRLQWHSKQVYVFDDNGRLSVIRDKQGNELTMGYYTAGNPEGAPAGVLKQVVDTRGRTAHFTYNTNGMLESVELRDPAGSPLVRYAYEYAGSPLRLSTSRVDFVDGSLMAWPNDGVNLDAKTTYRYDSNGRMFEVENARDEDRDTTTRTGGMTVRFTYKTTGAVDVVRQLTESGAIPDSVTSFDYTLGAENRPAACNGQGVNSTLVDGERTDVADTTRYCADEHDRVVRTVDANGHVRKATWTDNSNVETASLSGTEAGGSFTTTYDSNDNATAVQSPTGGTAGADYTDPSNLHFPTAMSDYSAGAGRGSNGQLSSPTWSYDYDDNGNLIEARAGVKPGTADDVVYRYCWDGDGQLQRIDPMDAAGNNSVSLDNDLNAGCGVASQGNDTLLTYDTDGNLTEVDPPGAHRTKSYTYDALSRVKTVTDGRGVRTTFAYDALGHVVRQSFGDDPTDSVTPPTGSATATVSWVYDRAGNVTKLTDATAETTYSYDELNRLTLKATTAPAAHTATFGYDPADNLTTATDSTMSGTVAYDYDPVNLLTSLDDPRLPEAITFAYNSADRRIKTTYPMRTAGVYNPDNPLIERTRYGDGGQLNCRYSYRLASSPLSSETHNPACPTSTATGLVTYFGYDYTKAGIDTNTRWKMTEKGNVVTAYDYDPISRLTSAEVKNGTGTVLRTFGYDYDRHSNLTRETATDPGNMPVWDGGTLSMAYNDAEELCWSLAGTSSNGCGTAPAGATSYSYDGAGSLTGDDTATAPLELVYNVIGQTTSINPAGTTHGPIPMGYLGVTQDDRVEKADTTMGYGFAGLATQNTTAGSAHREAFIRDPGGQLLAMRDTTPGGSGQVRYHLTDALGSIVATMSADGDQVRRYTYEPYGQQLRTWMDPNPTNVTTAGNPADGSYNTPTSADNGVDHNPWRFAGGYYDTEIGWLKYGTRYYMPDLVRWTQTDPMAGRPQQPLTQNPYPYANCNPANFTDPTGRSASCVVGAAAGTLAGALGGGAAGFLVGGPVGAGVGGTIVGGAVGGFVSGACESDAATTSGTATDGAVGAGAGLLLGAASLASLLFSD